MALLPRRVTKSETPVVPLPPPPTDAERREAALQKVRDTYQAYLSAQKEEEAFTSSLQGAWALDFVRVSEPIFLKGTESLILEILTKRTSDAAVAFQAAQAEFAREWSL